MTNSRACRRWRRTVWQEVDGTLAGARRARLLEHVGACEACRRVLELAGRLDQALASEPLTAPARGFEERVFLGLMAGLKGDLARPAPRARARDASSEAGDWWVLGIGLGTAALVAIAAALVLPRLALSAVSTAVSPRSGATAELGGMLTRIAQVMMSSAETIAGWLQSPLALAIWLMAGVLALTLGWIHLAMSRSPS